MGKLDDKLIPSGDLDNKWRTLGTPIKNVKGFLVEWTSEGQNTQYEVQKWERYTTRTLWLF